MNISRGFTLVELMITVAILAILVTVALASYEQYQRKSELSLLATEIMATADVARQERAKRGQWPRQAGLTLPYDSSVPKKLNTFWRWAGLDQNSYAGIEIGSRPVADEDLQTLDSLIDDGDLTTGSFRRVGADRVVLLLAGSF